MTLTERFDAYQRRHPKVGFPIGVIYKFGEDQGPYLAALITYYGFLSLFPLLLGFTILGILLSGDPGAQRAVLDSALSQFPVMCVNAMVRVQFRTSINPSIALV